MEKLEKKQLLMITNQKGSSLVLALIVSFMLIALVTISVHFSNTELISAKKQDYQISAYYIAEAGLERAILEINQSLEKGLEPEPAIIDEDFEGGSYEVTITPKLNDKNENIGFTIESVGTYGNEKEKVTQWVKQTLWKPGTEPIPSPFQFAMFAEDEINVQTLSGLLGIGNLKTHEIKVIGNIHANNYVELKHNGILTGDPNVSGIVNSTDLANIHISGLRSDQKQVNTYLSLPQFDFDYAREQAIKNGFYVPQPSLGISLIGLSPTDKVIFIDGDLTQVGLDLLGIAIQGRTLVVNGDINGLLELGGNEPLNIIAAGEIHFLGAVTGLKINGILFAQGDIKTEGHLEVNGYIGAKNIICGAGILSNLLGVLTGNMNFSYNESVFDSLPSSIGFKKETVEVVEHGVIPE